MKKERDGSINTLLSLTVIRIKFQFIDGTTGERTDMQEIVSYGDDPGDKGIYKALTGAVKYALMKTFLIATGDDPEADKSTDRRSAAAEASSSVTVQRGGQRAQQTQQLSPSQRARLAREQAATASAEGAAEQATGDPAVSAQPAPGGRQADANAPAERTLNELLKKAGVRQSQDAIDLIQKVLKVTIPVGADKAASLSSFLSEYKKDRQRFGKFLYDLRKYVEHPESREPETVEAAPEQVVAMAQAVFELPAEEPPVEPPDEAYEATEGAV